MQCVPFSGYGQKGRIGVYKVVTKKTSIQERAGFRPRDSRRSWNELDKNRKRIERKNTWYTKGKYQEVMFIECISNGRLARKYVCMYACENIYIEEMDIIIETP